MAPIKLEDHIREQFEEREIAPSASAWDKLESKLDKEQGKKRPLFIWYAVAASIVGMVFIASQFFFTEDVQIDQELVKIEEAPTIDKTMTSEILKTETQLAKENSVNDEEAGNASQKEEINKSTSDSKRNVTPAIETKKSTMNKVNDSRMAVQENNKTSSQKISEVIIKDLIVTNKVDEVVAAVQKIKQENNTVSVAEIDALLLSAQRDLATQRILNKTKIDATALLNDVEFELEKTFRDKVFDALGDSFSKIRTAVVERNN